MPANTHPRPPGAPRFWTMGANGRIRASGPHASPDIETAIPKGAIVAAFDADGVVRVSGTAFEAARSTKLSAFLLEHLQPDHPVRAEIYRYRAVEGTRPIFQATHRLVTTTGRLGTALDALQKALYGDGKPVAVPTAPSNAKAEGSPAAPSPVEECLERLVKKWQSENAHVTDPRSINEGPCTEWAEDAEEALATEFPGLKVEVLCEEDVLEPQGLVLPNYYHTFLRVEGRYYDAEATGGVGGWQQLPFFRRNAHNITSEAAPSP